MVRRTNNAAAAAAQNNPSSSDTNAAATTTDHPQRKTSKPTSSSNSSTGSRGSRNSRRSKKSQVPFNPRLIFSQIAALQSLHYLILSLEIQINAVLFGQSVTVDRIFTTKYLDVWNAQGWIDNSAVLLSSVWGALLLALIVEKSKKCLDFSVTLFLLHAVFCTIYQGAVPATWDWWIIHVLGMIIMVVLGEYLCSRRELSEIPLISL